MQNTQPTFIGKPFATPCGVDTGVTANTSKDATSGTVQTILTAPADGLVIHRIWLRIKGTTGGPSVFRLFLNNGGSAASATNNVLIGEATIPAITNSETAAAAPIDFPLPHENWRIPGGYVLLSTIGTALTNACDICVSASELSATL